MDFFVFVLRNNELACTQNKPLDNEQMYGLSAWRQDCQLKEMFFHVEHSLLQAQLFIF